MNFVFMHCVIIYLTTNWLRFSCINSGYNNVLCKFEVESHEKVIVVMNLYFYTPEGQDVRFWTKAVSTMPNVYFPSLSVILQSWKARIILGKSNLLKLCTICTQGSCFCINSTNKARALASWYVLTRWPWQNKLFPGKVKPLINRNPSAISSEFPKVRKWPSCYDWPVMSDALWEIGFVGVMWQSKLSLSLTAAIWKISASLCRDVVSMSQNIFLTYDHPNGFSS